MTAAELELDESHHTHHDNVAHHFDSMPQQFSSAKLGMWLFLGTEVLFFGGLFVFYSVVRNLHPEVFEYGSQFLDWRLGALNTVVLILSSLTMAAGVTLAQLGRRKSLIVCLLLTLLGGAIFMSVKYVEYSHKIHENLVWGPSFYEEPAHYAAHQADQGGEHEIAVADPVVETPAGNVERGKELFLATCRSCHGVRGEGVEGQGKPQQGSEFIINSTDEELIAFIKKGRMPWDPANTTGIQMPPKGGNPMLSTDDLRDIVAYVRTFVHDAPIVRAGGDDTLNDADAATEATDTEAETVATGVPDVEAFYIPKSSVPPANAGPPGLKNDQFRFSVPSDEPWMGHHSKDPNLPRNAHVYFGIYFALTGLHGIHVLVGMCLIAGITFAAIRGRFSEDYFTPVDLVGLYWHLVDLIWIFLFPLLYLI